MQSKFNIDKNDLIQFYIKENKSVKEIAEKYDCDKTTIYNKLKQFNIKKDKDLINKQAKITRQNTFDKLYNGHPMKNKDINNKSKNTRLIKNKGKYFSKESLDKIKQTKLDKYNNSNYNNREKALKTRYINNNGKYFSEESLSNLIEHSKQNKTRVENTRRTILNKTNGKYDWNWKIPEVHNKQQQTFNTKYNGCPLANKEVRDKISSTIYTKYNRTNFNQAHISEESFNILNNKDKFTEFITNKGLVESAKLLNVDPTTITNYCIKYNIDKNIMNLYQSLAQKEIINLIKTFYKGKIFNNYRKYKLEIDIYIPEFNLGIEYNGDYWHNSTNRDIPKTYHYDKSKYFEQYNIFIYHIYEYEWKTNKDQIINQIKNLMNLNKKLHAKSCYIKEISSYEAKQFLKNNHRQGTTYSSINIGLFLNKNKKGIPKDTLVSLMCFSKSNRNRNYQYELIRFCNKLGFSVIEGASTLFNYFIKNYNPESIISYSDIGTTKGTLYNILGFIYECDVSGGYVWTNFKQVFNREQCMKSKLSKLLNKNIDLKLTEKQIMENEGYVQIFNAGRRRHIWLRSKMN